ncbi:MAG: putative endoglucanase [Firmicutes bacterium ADurb.Bin193]|nr:MAG: putative endoglucanase [Firmicutes bacterium ADurb.Bin193]
MQKLVVSNNKRYLQKQDGTPFFWLADTAWELFHALSNEKADHYLKTRADQGFNCVQAVVLAELSGLTTPNHYERFPLKRNEAGLFDPTMPDTDGEYSYFDHVDYIVNVAESYGLYIAMLPTWGDKFFARHGVGPEIFTPQNAFSYGEFIGARYKNKDNIVWVMGGDRSVENPLHLEIVGSMALGIKKSGANQLITFHPCDRSSSSELLHHEDWLDFNMIQSGHTAPSKTVELITRDYNLTPPKPTIDAECHYEDHPISFRPENGYFDSTDVRRVSYWAVFSGSAGITYGHHSIWSMQTEEYNFPYYIKSWEQALTSPGAFQMRHLRELCESKDFQNGTPKNDILAKNFEGVNYQAAFGSDKTILVYSPSGLPVFILKDRLENRFTPSWFDPRSGEYQRAAYTERDDCCMFLPPNSGRNFDFVLVIDEG